jgi:hypothetical protein
MWLEEEVVQAVLAVVVLCSSTLVAHAHLWTQQQFDQVLIDVQSIQFTTDVEVGRYQAEGGGVDMGVEAVQIKFDVGAGLPKEFVERAQLNGVNGGGGGHGERGGSVGQQKEGVGVWEEEGAGDNSGGRRRTARMKETRRRTTRMKETTKGQNGLLWPRSRQALWMWMVGFFVDRSQKHLQQMIRHVFSQIRQFL